MKPWRKPEQKIVGDYPTPVIPDLHLSSSLIWDCVDCHEKATVMYEGTTFCRGCMETFQRKNYRR